VTIPTYWLERAWLGDGPVCEGVLVDVVDGVFTRVEEGPPGDAERLAGLTIPGLANCHSHAFHRALRGRTQRGRGTFWTWREQMYAVAATLTPDTYFELARATYREMVSVGITSVGEFHYLHHGRDGTPYDDPNAMSHALVAAAQEAGLRIALLDTCYLSAGIGRPVEGVQRRFSDGDADAWAARLSRRPVTNAAVSSAGRGTSDGSTVGYGAAIHSVRAVPRDQMRTVAAWAADSEAPLHVHLSEQVAENDACLAAYGVTPTRLLHEEGLLGPGTTVVHATHLTDDDIALLGSTRTNVCITPTTERDLADGVGPARALAEAGCRVTIGSDSHAVIDPFEELRGLEMDERLATEVRGHWSAVELLEIGTATRIAVGEPADLVTIDTATPRTAGTGADENTVVFAATGADVTHVVIDGQRVYTRADDEAIGRELDAAMGALWQRP
jgi:formiminoglutamate deiminase